MERRKAGRRAGLLCSAKLTLLVASILAQILQGTRMLILILVLVAVAAACTISQIAMEEDVNWIVFIETWITYFFIFELALRVAVYIVVHRELDSFLMEVLNLCDILVVTIDLIILSSPAPVEGEGGNDSAGLVKGLRSARGVRLLRLLRAARAFRLLNMKKKMTMEEAFADPRSCKVTFKEVSGRMIKYCDANCVSDGGEKEVVCLTLELLVNHLRKQFYLRVNPHEHLTDYERLRMPIAEVEHTREMAHMEKQKLLTNEARSPELILKIISTCSGKIFDISLILGEQLLCARNYDGQGVFFRAIDRGGRDGSFFVSIKDCLRGANENMKQYKELSMASTKKEECKAEVAKVLPLLKFLGLLCEGHFEKTQEIMRSQPKNVVTINVLEEVVNFMYLLGRSLPVLREFTDFECSLLLSCLAFLVECTQGPCKANQSYLAAMRKPVEVCKNIFCSSFSRAKDEQLSSAIYSKAMQLIAALLESRGGDETIHLILNEQIPPSMLETRLTEVRKKDVAIAKSLDLKKMHKKGGGSNVAGLIEKQAMNTAEVIAIYNICWELEPFGEEGKAFGRITAGGLDFRGQDQYGDDIMEDDGEGGGGGFDGGFEGSSRGSRGDESENLLPGDDENEGGGFDLGEDEIDSIAEYGHKVDAVEVVWHGECLKVHFTLPQEWASLSERKKEDFLDHVECTTSESRMKGLVDSSDDFLEHMMHMHKLKNQSNIFALLSTFYFTFKIVIFSLTLVLNFNMMLSTFQSLTDDASGIKFSIRSVFSCLSGPVSEWTSNETWNVCLSVVVVIGNLLVCVFVSVSEIPLSLARSRRHRYALHIGGSHKDKDFNPVPLMNYVSAIFIYCLLAMVHKGAEHFKFEDSTYVNSGLVLFGASFPFTLRSCLKSPRSQILNLFMDVYDTLSPVGFLMSFFQLVCSVVLMEHPFMMAFLLLDAGNMSKSLQLCFKAILIPFKQLLLTIMFFVIVIFVYSSVAFQAFGIEGYVGPDGNQMQCSSFADCFVLTAYITFRKSDIADILEFPTLSEDNFGMRVLFDLTFFIICGMFLFNMIGGLILDTFTHIRDEKERRRSIYDNEIFVTGITRNTIEEDPQFRGVTFSRLNEDDQFVWKYLFFIIYLKNKDSDEFTGVESYVAKCLKEESLKWLPSKTCVAVESTRRRGRGGGGGKDGEGNGGEEGSGGERKDGTEGGIDVVASSVGTTS